MPAALMIGHHFSISVFWKSAKRFLSAVRARKLLGKFREPRTRLGIDQRIHDGRIELGDHVRGRPNRARWIE
jgi:hypothetical protein